MLNEQSSKILRIFTTTQNIQIQFTLSVVIHDKKNSAMGKEARVSSAIIESENLSKQEGLLHKMVGMVLCSLSPCLCNAHTLIQKSKRVSPLH